MDLRLITVAFDSEAGAFPEQPLKDVEGEIVNVVEHFFHHQAQPHLLLVAHVRPPATDGKRPRRGRAGGGPREALGPADAEVYDRLRAWRNGRAESDGVPPFVILTNKQLADVARSRPADKTALRRVHGIGEAKSGRYGRQILQVVAHGPEAPASKPETRGPGGGRDGR